MSLLEQAPGLLQALQGEMTPKFLSTRSTDGIPNVVPVVSILPTGDQPDTLFFGNFLLRKSIRNLQDDTRVGILVLTEELRGWILKGDFLEFQRTGPYVERQMSSSLLRYNPYTGIRNAGLIRVRSLEGSFAISKWQVAVDYLRARLAALGTGRVGDAGVAMPLPVRQQFGKMIAVKVLAWLDEDDYPIIVPVLSLQPAGQDVMIGRTDPRLPVPRNGAKAAANILTFDAISYQAKGQWFGHGNVGRLLVQEVYAGGPPIPGGRVA